MLAKDDTFYKRSVERSLYIEELLYTKSQCLLRVNRIANLADVKNVEIPCEKNQVIKPEPLPKPVPKPVLPIDPIRPVYPIYPVDSIRPIRPWGYPQYRDIPLDPHWGAY